MHSVSRSKNTHKSSVKHDSVKMVNLRTGDWINALASIQRPTYIAVEGVKGVGKGSTLSWVYDELTRRQIRYVTLNPTQPLEADHHW
jgi:hypothetical protein